MLFGTCLSNIEVQIVKGKICASSSMMSKNPEIMRVTSFFSAKVHADTSAYKTRTLGNIQLGHFVFQASSDFLFAKDDMSFGQYFATGQERSAQVCFLFARDDIFFCHYFATGKKRSAQL